MVIYTLTNGYEWLLGVNINCGYQVVVHVRAWFMSMVMSGYWGYMWLSIVIHG